MWAAGSHVEGPCALRCSRNTRHSVVTSAIQSELFIKILSAHVLQPICVSLAGVIAYEAITDHSAFGFSKQDQVLACARGERMYIWEQPNSASMSAAAKAFERSRISKVVLQCLTRNPSERPNASQLVHAIDRISNATQTGNLAAPGVAAGTVQNTLASDEREF